MADPVEILRGANKSNRALRQSLPEGSTAKVGDTDKIARQDLGLQSEDPEENVEIPDDLPSLAEDPRVNEDPFEAIHGAEGARLIREGRPR